MPSKLFMKKLNDHYEVEDRERVFHFIDNSENTSSYPSLLSLLLEAPKQITAHFSTQERPMLSIISDENSSQLQLEILINPATNSEYEEFARAWGYEAELKSQNKLSINYQFDEEVC